MRALVGLMLLLLLTSTSASAQDLVEETKTPKMPEATGGHEVFDPTPVPLGAVEPIAPVAQVAPVAPVAQALPQQQPQLEPPHYTIGNVTMDANGNYSVETLSNSDMLGNTAITTIPNYSAGNFVLQVKITNPDGTSGTYNYPLSQYQLFNQSMHNAPADNVTVSGAVVNITPGAGLTVSELPAPGIQGPDNLPEPLIERLQRLRR